MECLYHLCAQDFRGTHLLPLSHLRLQYPEVYEREREKWIGRECVLDYVVPCLGMTWADTVNLSALHPKHLVAKRKELGVPFSKLLERNVVCIPTNRLVGLPAVKFYGNSYWRNNSPGDLTVPETPPESEFSPFFVEEYREFREVPEFHSHYLLRQRERGERALGFVGVPHVLVGAAIDLSGLVRVPLLDLSDT